MTAPSGIAATAASPEAPTAAPASRAVVADEPGIGAWRTFLTAHARITRRLDEELQASHSLSLAEYDALLQIAHAPGRRVRMNVLAERVILSRSGITRLIDRLEAAGSVERIACRTDARGCPLRQSCFPAQRRNSPPEPAPQSSSDHIVYTSCSP